MLTAQHGPSPLDMLTLGLACLGAFVLFIVAKYALDPYIKEAMDKYAGTWVQWWRDRQEWKKVGEEKYPDTQLPERYWHQWHKRGQRKGRR
jgi:hypothetical protein